MKAMTLLWIGSIFIFFSIALQAAALLLQPFALAFTMSGLVLNAFSVPFTIVQAYRSALEQQQLLEQERRRNEAVAQNMAIRSSELRLVDNLINRDPDTYNTDSGELGHSKTQ